jgi:AP-2 complex subunit alpha
MTAYDRKKYVWKLVYINMLGYDVDFGHMEMISLVSSPTYAEKLVGYVSVAVMLRNTDEQITLVVQAIKNDLQSTQDPIQCLALAGIANIGGKELAETVAPDVQRILFSRAIFPVVRKKAALCLLRLVRISRDLMPADEWSKKLITLLEDKHLGVVLSVVTLLSGLAERDPASYEAATGHLLVWLTRLAVNKHVTEDYIYHGTPCPWLQVRILRLLQAFPVPATEAMRTRLNEVLAHIMNTTEVTKSVNRNNAEHCVLFEAVNLIIKQGDASEPGLRGKAVAHLSKFINIREPNIRYLGLETMARLTALEGTGEAIRKQQPTIMFSLKDSDISIRRRALDLLFAMCDRSIAESVVKELLQYLSAAEYAIKDEMVLKLAILAERFAPDLRWYVDNIVQLLNIAGDFVSDDIWHRVVQIVTNHQDLQKYAASKMYHALEPITAHETVVKVGGYIIGEFGYLLLEGDEDGGPAISGAQQFAVLHQHFPKCSVETKCILLSSYAKLQNLYPELRALILPIFEAHTTVLDPELQQRAVEYLHLPDLSAETLSTVLDVMPAFPERASILEARLKRSNEETHDKDVWEKEDKPGAAGIREGMYLAFSYIATISCNG